jgi:hypothetical protein
MTKTNGLTQEESINQKINFLAEKTGRMLVLTTITNKVLLIRTGYYKIFILVQKSLESIPSAPFPNPAPCSFLAPGWQG